MHPPPSRRTPAPRLILCLIGLLALAGCQEDEITHGIVPRTAEPEKTRLLGVIYPHGDQTWFFKLMGPESAFADVGDPFNDFMQSVRFADKAGGPTWTLPAGWKQEDAPKPPLFASIRVADKPLKLTVAALPHKQEGEVLDNVNRWRGQLGLEPIDKAGLAAVVKETKVGADLVTLVDMTGSGAAVKPAKGPVWTYSVPDGWAETPHPEAGPIPREALFQIADGGQKAEASVTSIGGPAGGLEANVARWCRQIEAPELTPEQIAKLPTITVGGRESPYLDLAGKKGRTLGVVVSVGDKTWFFKLTGPADLVDKQKTKFEEFIKSVKFDAGMRGEQ